MNIEIKRTIFTSKSTIGLLFVDGKKMGYTLEDVARPNCVKVQNETAIPAGEYSVIIDDSTRFKRPMPHILNVPGFEGVRIHKGNTSTDTEGCVLVGLQMGTDQIWDCAAVFDPLFALMKAALDKLEAVELTITNEQA